MPCVYGHGDFIPLKLISNTVNLIMGVFDAKPRIQHPNERSIRATLEYKKNFPTHSPLKLHWMFFPTRSLSKLHWISP